MNCDTTGVEPDFALVKFKKLSGGGYFKIINQSIPLGLRNLGYNEAQIESIVKYVVGHATLEGAPHINHQTLKAKGFKESELQNLESGMLSAFDLSFVFNVYSLGEECLKRLGFAPEAYKNPEFNLIKELGFTPAQLEAANEYVCGTMTIEGAPYLKIEHYPVFDCANKCGTKGTRFIHQHGHIRMMAAAQPFISGAISKTINLPHEATVEEVAECYLLSWELGLKAISIYRDGSKLSQPLSAKSDKKKDEDKDANQENAFGEKSEIRPIVELSQEQIFETVKQILAESGDNDFKANLRQIVNRRELPMKRKGWTQKNKVGGQTIFLRTGEYDDGKLGEIFIDMHKEGATLRSMLNCFAISVSIGLQYGVPLEEFVDKFAFTRFEPSGMVDHPNLKSATSMIDYIFRLLAFEYLDRDDLVQISREAMIPQYSTPTERQVHITVPQAELVIKTRQNGSSNGSSENGHSNGNGKSNGQSNGQKGHTNGHTHDLSVSHSTNGQTNGQTNGYSNGHNISPEVMNGAPTQVIDSSQALLSNLMGDAPACNVCGHITVRSGTCYKCLNCGNSLGCS